MGDVINPQEHHIRMKVATSRPLYRKGRRETAVKVFTINDESIHLLIIGVPSIGLQEELAARCSQFGNVRLLCKVPDYPSEEFTEVYHVVYEQLSSVRYAKKRLDGLEFYGSVLHVCYAPELETIDETRDKIAARSKMVNARREKCKKYKSTV